MRLAALALLCASFAPRAFAQSAALPLAQAQRPLALPPAVLRLDAGPAYPLHDHSLALSLYENGAGERHARLGTDLGLSAGLLPGLQAGVVFLPLSLLPDAAYGQPSFHLLQQPAELPLGVFFELTLPTRGDFGALLGVPIRAIAGQQLRLTTGPHLGLRVDPEAHLDFLVSAEALVNLDASTFIGLELAVAFPSFGDPVIPLVLFFGLSFPYGTRVLGDLRFSLGLDDLGSGFDALTLGVRLDLFFDV